MKKHVLAGLAVATTMGFFTPLTGHAFGLGQIEVMSALNEPFKAEIDVTALRPDERDNLQVRIASDAEFDKAGLNRSIFLGQLQFDIIQRNGQDKILITSSQAVKEPFLDFLLSATAGSGVLLREYTVLLDPPEYVLAETRAATTQATRAATTPVETKPTTTRYQYAADSGQRGDSYSVKRNDTLWNVALQTRPSDSISVHQMMMALLNANRSAFTSENVNGLKAGVTLQIPSQSQINSLSKAAAQAAFAKQNEAWENRNKAAAPAVVQPEPVSEQTAGDVTAGPEETTPAADVQAETTEVTGDSAAPATATDPEARLHLVAPEEVNTSDDDASPNVQGDEDIRQLTEQLTLAQETIEAQTQENIDFKSRMDAMEEQLETMRRLISLKDADLARLQDMLEEEDPALAAEAAAGMQGDALAATDVASEEMADSEPSAAAPTDADSQADDTDAAMTEQAESNEQQEEGFISDVARALNLDQQQVQSTIGKVKQFVTENKLPTALGLLLVLLVLWLIARRSSREVTWDEAVKKMDKADKKEAAAAPIVTPAFEDDITDAPLDEEQGEEKSVGELVEQADMFVGYADYVQARTSLEQARNIEPENTLVAYKLLFVLYKQQHADEFRTLVEDTAFDKDGFEWQEIKNWGQQLLPGDELFAGQTSSQAASSQPQPAADSSDSEQPVAEARQDDHLEFDLNDFADTSAEKSVESDEQEHKPAAEADDDLLTFDTNYGLDKKADKEDTGDTPDESLKLDIDADNAEEEDRLSFDEADQAESLEMDSIESDDTSPGTDADDVLDLEFDIGDLDDIDEVETKLDLAAAYVDMGDPDGARSILNEVLVEGNEEQKNRAHELLNSLS